MKAKKIEKKFNEFGKKRVDNYFWMRDKNNPDVLKYIKHENKLTDDWLSDTKNLQEKLFKELKSRKRDKDESVPYFYNGYWYIKKFEKGKEYPVLFRKKGSLKAKAEKIIDQNVLAKGKKYYNIGGAGISPDNRYFAYAEDTKADRKYILKIKDLKTGKNLKDTITDISTAFIWGNDSRSIFYVKVDEITLRPFLVKRHILDRSQEKDETVFEERNEIYYVSLEKTRSQKFILIDIGCHDHEFQYYFNADGEIYEPKLFAKPKSGIIYDIDHGNGFWCVRTNLKALDFEIYRAPENKIDQKYWKIFIPAKDGVQNSNFLLFKNHFAYEQIITGIPYFKVLNLVTGKTKSIKFKEKLYGGDFLFNPEYDSSKLRLSFETMKDPEIEYEYNMNSGKMKVLKVHKPKGKHNPEDYVVERKWVKSHDGVKVPISLFYKKGIKKDGGNPCLLYGYGSYGYSTSQSFNDNVLALVNRGFIFAVAHIRGGQEMGRAWYLDGKLLKKKNTFYDFVAAGEYLVKQKHTSREKLFAMGGSAGGLLMGAVANMRPNLWGGMVFYVPFVDVINTMLDASIPLTTGEYVEWGNPNQKKYLNYMKSYAPYENIERKDYPAILIESGFNDTQVHYWEPLKYLAKMKEYKTDQNPILLKMDLDTGHGGKSGRFSYLRDTARVYAFLLKLSGIKN